MANHLIKLSCYILAISIILFAPFTANAVKIIPSSYTFSPQNGHQGTWTYDDPLFNKLTDGIYGTDDWTVNQGAEWTGWWGIEWDGTTDSIGAPLVASDNYNVRNIQIEFMFGSKVRLSSLVLGTNQDAITNWNVIYPSSIKVTSGGLDLASVETPFSPDNSGNDNGYNSGKRHDVVINFQPLITDSITISLNNGYNFINHDLFGIEWDNNPGSPHNGMFWLYIDEVDFHDTHQPVPEPSTILLSALGLSALIVLNRKKLLLQYPDKNIHSRD